jgi:ribosomal-protein-alanine N-acetyltransferase
VALGEVAMQSERLTYAPLAPAGLDAFHRLVQDEHVRRYMMDGQVFPREWSEARVRESQALLEGRRVMIWLAHDLTTGEPVGFCGFWVAPSFPEPQLLYALLEPWTGRGLATEMARAVIAHARTQPGFAEIVADVDAVNVRSVRLLETLGFERVGIAAGAFGDVRLDRLPATR